MKILLANKFYYRRGGDCVHTLNLEQLLKAHGHEVAVFAMDYPENLKTQWSKYFPSEVKFKLGTGMIEALMRPFGTREVQRKFNALLNDFHLWGIERSVFFNGREKWAKGFENQRV